MIFSSFYQKRSSSATISAYSTDLRLFRQFLTGLNSGFDPTNIGHWNQVTSKTVDHYVLWLQNQKFKLSTINRKLTVVRSFCRYLSSQGYLLISPMDDRVLNYPEHQVPEILSQDSIERIREQVKKSQGSESSRDLALVTIIYATGIRSSELVGLDIGDLASFDHEHSLICRGQKGIRREIVLDNQTSQIIWGYFWKGRPKLVKNSDEKALFLSKSGVRLTRAGVWLIICKHARAAGLEGKVNPKILRHSFIARMFAQGKTLKEVQDLVGQVSLSASKTEFLSGMK